MTINFSSYSYSKPYRHDHKYISNIILDKEEMAKLEQAINALKNMAENQATFQPNVYIPCNGFQAKIIQGILGNSLDEINYTEN